MKWNVLYILFCAVNFSQQKWVKHGHGLLVRGATPEYPAFTLIILILLAQIGTWRRVLFSLPKGAGHGHSLVTGAVFRPANQELQYYSDLQKTLSSRIVKSPLSIKAKSVLQRPPQVKWGVARTQLQRSSRSGFKAGATPQRLSQQTVKQLFLTGNL